MVNKLWENINSENIFIDPGFILDLFEKREPFYFASVGLFTLIVKKIK